MTDGRPAAAASPARAARPARTRSGALLLTPSSSASAAAARAAARGSEGAARAMVEGEVRVLLEGVAPAAGAGIDAAAADTGSAPTAEPVLVSRVDPLAAAAGPSAMAAAVRLKTRGGSSKSTYNEGVLVRCLCGVERVSSSFRANGADRLGHALTKRPRPLSTHRSSATARTTR